MAPLGARMRSHCVMLWLRYSTAIIAATGSEFAPLRGRALRRKTAGTTPFAWPPNGDEPDGTASRPIAAMRRRLHKRPSPTRWQLQIAVAPNRRFIGIVPDSCRGSERRIYARDVRPVCASPPPFRQPITMKGNNYEHVGDVLCSVYAADATAASNATERHDFGGFSRVGRERF